MYYLTIRGKQKRAKRHVVTKSLSFTTLLKTAENLDKKRYKVEIYNGKWELEHEVL